MSIAIDMGTTNCCVAINIKRNGHLMPEVIENDLGMRITPSAVFFEDNNQIIGQPALDNGILQPTFLVYSIKRIIGRKFSEIKDDIKYWPFKVINDGNDSPVVEITKGNGTKEMYSPELLSSFILKYLKNIAEKKVGNKITNLVITVPAFFTNWQRKATKMAAQIAGFKNVQQLSEPTAAAIAYGFSNFKEKMHRVLVFDFGGGTFDVSILEIKGNTFKEVCRDGNSRCGGDDIDIILMKYFAKEFKKENKGFDPLRNDRSMQLLKTYAKQYKEYLSFQKSVNVSIVNLMNNKDFNITITRKQFEEMCKPLLDKCIDTVADLLNIEGFTASDIDDIVLVGGSSNIPKIKAMLFEMFGKEPISGVNASEAIAIGAVTMANDEVDIQHNAPGQFTVNRTTKEQKVMESIGVREGRDGMRLVFQRGNPLPCSRSLRFGPAKDFAAFARVRLLRGEEERAQIGVLRFPLPSRPAADVEFVVTVSVDVNQRVHCSASIDGKTYEWNEE